MDIFVSPSLTTFDPTESDHLPGAAMPSPDRPSATGLALNQAVLDALPNCGACLAATDGTVIAWYQGAKRLIGYTSEEMVGNLRLHDLLAPESPPLGALTPGHHQALLRRRDGSHLHVQITVGALQEGTIAAHVVLLRDISGEHHSDKEREQYESNLATVFNTIKEQVFIVDLDGTVRDANRAAREAYGRDIRGRDLCRLVRDRRDPDLEPVLRRCVLRFEPVSEEQQLPSSSRTVEITVYPLFGRSRRLKNLLVLEQDITSERLMELEIRLQHRQLKDSAQRLEEVDRARRHWLNAVSHELRTPLTSIRSYSELLLAYPAIPGGERTEFLGIILKESERLSRLIGDLLDLAHIESGKLAWNPIRHDLLDTCRRCRESMLAQAEDAGLDITVRALAEKIEVYADRDRLQQVLINLLANACKFSPEGGTIAIELHADPTNAYLAVEDQGPGIPVEERSAIFDFFAQGREAPTERPRGTGLGLAISRQIVEHHGGQLVCVDAHTGGGARFEVVLPRLLDHCERTLDSTRSRYEDSSTNNPLQVRPPL